MSGLERFNQLLCFSQFLFQNCGFNFTFTFNIEKKNFFSLRCIGLSPGQQITRRPELLKQQSMSTLRLSPSVFLLKSLLALAYSPGIRFGIILWWLLYASKRKWPLPKSEMLIFKQVALKLRLKVAIKATHWLCQNLSLLLKTFDTLGIFRYGN